MLPPGRARADAATDFEGAAGAFVTLRGAFEVLADARRRAEYDERCAAAEAAFVAPPAVTTFEPGGFEELVEARPVGAAPWLVVFTMGPDSPCGPCHQLRPLVREAAAALRPHVRVGVLHCDVARLKRVCESQMEGRGYYPIVKLYAAPGVARILDLEPQRPELPSGTVIKLVSTLVQVLGSVRKPPDRFWAEPRGSERGP